MRCWSVVGVLACLGSGAALWAAIFAPGWRWLAWIGLVPYAWVLSPRTPAVAAYGGAFLGSAVFHMLGLWWICACLEGVLAAVWFWLTLTAAVSCLGLTFLGRVLTRTTGWPMAVLLPLVWVTWEYVRHQGFALVDGGGFPLLWLGLALAGSTHFAQIADLAGVLALTWLAATVNGGVFDALLNLPGRRAERRPRAAMVSAGVAVVSLAAASLYGQWRLSQPLEPPGPTVALVAGTVLGEGNLLGLGELPPSARRLAAATEHSAEQDLPDTIDLFVWPEAAFAEPVSALAMPRGQGAQSPPDKGVQTVQAIARSLGAPVLIGAMRRREIPTPQNVNLYNSFLYVSGEEGLLGVYDKHHLIPWIEFPPKLSKWVGSLGVAPLGGGAAGWEGLRPGSEAEPFLLQAADGRRQFRVGATLCYDVFFPDVHRRYLANGQTGSPDLFVCGLNDCFDRTGMVARLSLMHTRLRAIEFRRPYFRASRGGVSAAVDSCGRVVAQASERAGEPAVIVAQVAGDHRRTIYSTCGDWLGLAASAVVIGSAVVPRARRLFTPIRRFRSTVARDGRA